MRAACATLVAAVASFVHVAAHAEPAERLRLEWRAPAGCPSRDAVRDAAVRSAGVADAGDDAAPLEARADVQRAARWRVTIRTSRGGTEAETRSLEASSCGALAEATAVVLGVALIPGRALTASVTVAPSPVEADEEASSTRPDPPRPAVSGPERIAEAGPAETPTPSRGLREHRFAIGAELAGVTGVLPAVAGGARIAAAWTPRAFRVEAAGSYFSGQSRTTGSSGAGARFELRTASARACWAPIRTSVQLGPCAGLDVQHMGASGFGAATNYDASGTWLAGSLGVLVRVPLGARVALRADVDAVAPFTRPRFVVENDGAVHEPAGIGARAAIGAEVQFF